ncbi:NosR/NirI family protein [Cereibacter sediminicola]|uniref:NosR/NirI family protein n=1 Tax=Cereibacter sediminicola TaxID=2584941 RepID=UPI0011A7858F|nr:NosR/NirI family protein [Cereibacter sediminicola]
MPSLPAPGRAILLRLLAALATLLLLTGLAQANEPFITRFAAEVPAARLVPGADGYGPLRGDIAVVPVLKGTETLGYAFVTSDFVGTTGYSGKPIHVLMAVGLDGRVSGVELVKHSEPIVLVGIPDARIRKMVSGYVGMDLVAEAAEEGAAHEIDIISGATVTIMVIDDSIVRSGLKVARALGLGGLAAEAARQGPRLELDPEAAAPADWLSLTGDGTLRRLSLDVAQINAAFAAHSDPRAAARPHAGADEATFIDMVAGLVSVPGIGRSLLGEAEQANLGQWVQPGDHVLMLAGRGAYSYKGSGYVRGGIFDRIVLVQGDVSIRFRDRMHRRLGAIAAAGAPQMTEMDLFRIPADSGFDPAEPFRIQLLVQREVGPIEKVFTTFDLGYQLPARYLRAVAPAAAVSAGPQTEAAAQAQLWKRIWQDNRGRIAALLTMLGVLTAAFFFQSFLTASARLTFWFRIAFLSTTLVVLGWYANAQLSVVNLMALVGSLRDGFSWQAFLLDPMTFILWFSVAAALVFWGRGAYCGWLCPFGALQELTNRLAKLARIPQVTLPWGLHERLWAVKYILFLGLFGVSLASIEQAEHLAEVEPFKTAIILKFDRAWPFVLYALVLLGIGLFVERFYCRYLCPLGAGLAIPARIRMFDWLKRYRECGNPCQTCARDCMVQAIHPTGEINPNECLNCLNCQVHYQSKTTCPVVIKKLKRRETASANTAAVREALEQAIQNHPNVKGKAHV